MVGCSTIPSGTRGQRLADRAQLLLAYRRLSASDLAMGLADALPPPFEPHRAIGLVARRGLELLVEMVTEFVDEVIDLLPGDFPLVDELARVNFPASSGVPRSCRT